MKKIKKGMLWTVACAMLAFVMVFSLAACNTDNGGNSNGLMLNAYSMEIDEGDKKPLAVTTTTLAEAVEWSSSDEDVATVQGGGKDNRQCMVSAHQIGTATITAKSGDKSATCTVTVVAAEIITITKDGAEVKTDIQLSGKDATVQLAASSSRGHDIVWSCDKDGHIATVSDNGLVTAVATSGTVTVTATCAKDSKVSSKVTVKVGNGTDSVYTIQQGDESAQYGNPVNSNALPGTWIYWNQFGNVANAVYNEGVIDLKTQNISGSPWWYNVQLFYTAPASEKLEKGKLYEVTFDFDLERYDVDEDGNEVVLSSEDWTGQITVNGYVVDVKDGENHCTAYYEHNVTAFSMQLGVEKRAACDILNATIKLSNIKWKVAEPIQLQAPSFSISGNEINISDPNEKGVGSYMLNLYDGTTRVGSVLVEDKKPIDTSKINVKEGTFTAQLIAISANANYLTSAESKVNENNTLTIDQEHSQYTMSNGGAGAALLEVGTWTYWHESWVSFTGSVTDGKATITFSNNTGNWYDTQLFYKVPSLNKDDKYNAKLHINNVPNKGKVSINGHVYELQEGDNEIDLKTLYGETATSVTEGSIDNGTSITIVFGVDGQSNKQEITATTGTGIVVYLDGIEKVQETA